ncbi:MAG: hypothetical protein ACUVTU_02625 [Desulfurispora sp.]|uniref:hypothetical protein n=1 Tax=Desulfurispora sp. TaxID=3014275 RepID=UPI00404A948B
MYLYHTGWRGVSKQLTQDALQRAEKQVVSAAVQKQIQQDMQQMRQQVQSGDSHPASPGAPGNSNRQGPGPSVQQEIENRYLDLLQTRVGSYESRLYGLLYAAREEYRAARKNGGSLREIARKYLGAGRALESQCDAEVDAILASFAQELQSNNLSTAVVERARNAYETAKSERRAQILQTITKQAGQ